MSAIIRAGLVLTLAWTLLHCDHGASTAPTSKLQPTGHPATSSPPLDAGKRTQSALQQDAGLQKDADAAVVLDDGADAGGTAAVHCGSGACDLLDPAACPSGGCVLAFSPQAQAEPRTQCVAVGEGGDGAACSSYADCQAGLDCTTSPDPGRTGQCRRYCCELNGSRGCPAGQFCRIGIENGHGALTGVFVCDQCDDCDLRDATACGDGKGCYVLAENETCRVCRPAGGARAGEPCRLNDDCQAGTGCLSVGAQTRCLAFCDLAAASSCPGGASCRTAVGLSLPSGTGVCF
jgi:hypothetical protein